jgi:hypothetical protein
MVKPDVNCGKAGDATFTLTIRIKGKKLGEHPTGESFASSGII